MAFGEVNLFKGIMYLPKGAAWVWGLAHSLVKGQIKSAYGRHVWGQYQDLLGRDAEAERRNADYGLTTASSNLETAGTKVEGQKESLENYSNELTRHNTGLELVQGHFAQAQENSKTAEKQLGEEERKLEKAKQRAQELDAEIRRLETEGGHLAIAQEGIEEKLKKAREELQTAKEGEEGGAQTRCAQAQEALDNLQKKLKENEKKLTKNQDELAQKQYEKTKADGSVTTLDGATDLLKKTQAQHTEELADAKATLAQAERDRQALNLKILNKQAEVDAANTEKERAAWALKEAQTRSAQVDTLLEQIAELSGQVPSDKDGRPVPAIMRTNLKAGELASLSVYDWYKERKDASKAQIDQFKLDNRGRYGLRKDAQVWGQETWAALKEYGFTIARDFGTSPKDLEEGVLVVKARALIKSGNGLREEIKQRARKAAEAQVTGEGRGAEDVTDEDIRKHIVVTDEEKLILDATSSFSAAKLWIKIYNVDSGALPDALKAVIGSVNTEVDDVYKRRTKFVMGKKLFWDWVGAGQNELKDPVVVFGKNLGRSGLAYWESQALVKWPILAATFPVSVPTMALNRGRVGPFPIGASLLTLALVELMWNPVWKDQHVGMDSTEETLFVNKAQDASAPMGQKIIAAIGTVDAKMVESYGIRNEPPKFPSHITHSNGLYREDNLAPMYNEMQAQALLDNIRKASLDEAKTALLQPAGTEWAQEGIDDTLEDLETIGAKGLLALRDNEIVDTFVWGPFKPLTWPMARAGDIVTHAPGAALDGFRWAFGTDEKLEPPTSLLGRLGNGLVHLPGTIWDLDSNSVPKGSHFFQEPRKSAVGHVINYFVGTGYAVTHPFDPDFDKRQFLIDNAKGALDYAGHAAQALSNRIFYAYASPEQMFQLQTQLTSEIMYGIDWQGLADETALNPGATGLNPTYQGGNQLLRTDKKTPLVEGSPLWGAKLYEAALTELHAHGHKIEAFPYEKLNPTEAYIYAARQKFYALGHKEAFDALNFEASGVVSLIQKEIKRLEPKKEGKIEKAIQEQANFYADNRGDQWREAYFSVLNSSLPKKAEEDRAVLTTLRTSPPDDVLAKMDDIAQKAGLNVHDLHRQVGIRLAETVADLATEHGIVRDFLQRQVELAMEAHFIAEMQKRGTRIVESGVGENAKLLADHPAPSSAVYNMWADQMMGYGNAAVDFMDGIVHLPEKAAKKAIELDAARNKKHEPRDVPPPQTDASDFLPPRMPPLAALRTHPVELNAALGLSWGVGGSGGDPAGLGFMGAAGLVRAGARRNKAGEAKPAAVGAAEPPKAPPAAVKPAGQVVTVSTVQAANEGAALEGEYLPRSEPPSSLARGKGLVAVKNSGGSAHAEGSSRSSSHFTPVGAGTAGVRTGFGALGAYNLATWGYDQLQRDLHSGNTTQAVLGTESYLANVTAVGADFFGAGVWALSKAGGASEGLMEASATLSRVAAPAAIAGSTLNYGAAVASGDYQRAAGAAGSLGGCAALMGPSAKVGALIGTAIEGGIPGPGTVVGGAIGGGLGCLAGAWGGDKVAKGLYSGVNGEPSRPNRGTLKSNDVVGGARDLGNTSPDHLMVYSL